MGAWIWRAFVGICGAAVTACGLLLAAAAVSPEQVESGLKLWADHFLGDAPSWLAIPDLHVQAIAVLGACVGIAGGVVSWRRMKRADSAAALADTSVSKPALLPTKAAATPAKRLSFRDVFDTDFERCVSFNRTIRIGDTETGKVTDIPVRICQDYEASSEFFAAYMVDVSNDVFGKCVHLAHQIPIILQETAHTGTVALTFAGEIAPKTNSELVFSGRVYIYLSGSLSMEQMGELDKLYRSLGMKLTLRFHDYFDKTLQDDARSERRLKKLRRS